MPTTPVELLLEKYLSGTLSEAERLQLQDYLQDPVRQEEIAAILSRELSDSSFEIAEDAELLARMQANIRHRIQAPARQGRVVRRRFVSMAAAAVIFLVAGVAAWWWWPSAKQVPEAATAQKTSTLPMDVRPGGQRAILKLADGTEITLDSAGNGMVARQGAIKVIKQEDGRISYDRQQQAVTETLYNTITTPKGGQYQLLLADGSRVWLNAASSLRFPVAFTGAQRTVELQGEGYFEIAHNAAKPFLVRTNNQEVQVLGTHFNINAYADEPTVRTTLLEGKVKVQSTGSHTPAAVTLQPGQQAVCAGNGTFTLANQVDVEEVMAWKNGLFYFKSADLATILRQAARWYDVDIEYDEKITQRFSGQISRNVNASQLLSILELTGKVRFEITGKKIKVKPI